MKKITILGTGAFGLSLALMFNKNDTDIIMWSKFTDEVNILEINRTSNLLPNITIPDEIKFTDKLKEALNNTDLIVIALPSFIINDILRDIKEIGEYKNFCLASKGLDHEKGRFLYETICENFPNANLAVISGPTFAIDIANNAVSGLSVATKSKTLASLLQKTLANKSLKLRTTDDIVGVSICGSLKNVLAIGSGIIYGMESSDTTKAMFLTEAVNEVKNIIKLYGGTRKTINSFAGFGDILMTCTSENSRNFTLGKMIGEKRERNEIISYINNATVEGYITLKTMKYMFGRRHINIELFNILEDIILYKKPPELLLTWLIEHDKEHS